MAEPAQLAPRRRERQRLETRNRLFEAALAEFRRAGFAGAQVTRIAEAAGVAHGTFFFHFPTKEHVLLELQRRAEVRIADRLRTLRRKPTPVKAFLQQVIDAIRAEELSAGPDLLREILALHVRRTDLNVPTPIPEALTEYFVEAGRRGEVRTDLTAAQLTGIFLASIFGSLLGSVESPSDRRPQLQGVIDVFLRGMAP